MRLRAGEVPTRTSSSPGPKCSALRNRSLQPPPPPFQRNEAIGAEWSSYSTELFVFRLLYQEEGFSIRHTALLCVCTHFGMQMERSKEVLRGIVRQCEEGEGVAIPAELYDSDGDLDEAHIRCAICQSGESTDVRTNAPPSCPPACCGVVCAMQDCNNGRGRGRCNLLSHPSCAH